MKRSTPLKRTPLRPSSKPMKSGTPLARTAGPTRRTRKPKRFAVHRNAEYRHWIASLPCILADRHRCHGPVECCHVKTRGAGGDDVGNCFPGCRWVHQKQHLKGIKTFQALYSLDLTKIAKQLEAHWVLRDFGGIA